jgi:hypothetical protein
MCAVKCSAVKCSTVQYGMKATTPLNGDFPDLGKSPRTQDAGPRTQGQGDSQGTQGQGHPETGRPRDRGTQGQGPRSPRTQGPGDDGSFANSRAVWPRGLAGTKREKLRPRHAVQCSAVFPTGCRNKGCPGDRQYMCRAPGFTSYGPRSLLWAVGSQLPLRPVGCGLIKPICKYIVTKGLFLCRPGPCAREGWTARCPRRALLWGRWTRGGISPCRRPAWHYYRHSRGGRRGGLRSHVLAAPHGRGHRL